MTEDNIHKLLEEIRNLGIEDGWGYQIIEADMDGFIKWIQPKLETYE